MTSARANKYDISPAPMTGLSLRRPWCTIALVLFLAALPADAEEAKPAAADFFPLRVDYSWTYRNTSDDSQFTLKVLRRKSRKMVRFVI